MTEAGQNVAEVMKTGPPEKLVWSNPKGSDDEGKRYTTEQKIRTLREGERSGTTVIDVCREYRIIEQTFHRWKRELGMPEVDQAKQRKS